MYSHKSNKGIIGHVSVGLKLLINTFIFQESCQSDSTGFHITYLILTWAEICEIRCVVIYFFTKPGEWQLCLVLLCYLLPITFKSDINFFSICRV